MQRVLKNERDVLYILDNLRAIDKKEVIAIHGNNYKQKVFDSIMETDFYVLLGKSKNKNTPVTMGGIWEASSLNKDIGIVWLLSTDEVKSHIICLLKEIKKEIDKADEKFWLTYNLIYKENIQAKRFLKKLGYRFDNPKPDCIDVPDGFEFFYRIRPIKGLGE